MSFSDLPLIRDVTNVLKKLITDNIPELSSTTSVVLDSPGEISSSISQNHISLFLYQISENPFLKNQDWQPEGPNRLRLPPVSVDLYYLLTPYARDKEMEQIILSKVIRLFYDYSILSGPSLGTNLLQSGNQELRLVMNSLSLEQINHLWGMFAGKSYHIGLSYVITPLLITSAKEIDMQRVTAKQVDYYSND